MKYLVAAMFAAMVLAGCTASPPESDKPIFGGTAAPTPKASELAQAKAAAGIEDCPVTKAVEAVDNGLPAVTLDCLGGGRRVELSGLTGTPTVINLWASWCGPCKEELPLLAKADREFGRKLRMVGIDFADDSPDLAIALAARAGVKYPSLSDPKSTTKSDLKVVGLPQTVFVNAQGTIVATERRAYRSYDDLTAAILRHLGVRP